MLQYYIFCHVTILTHFISLEDRGKVPSQKLKKKILCLNCSGNFICFIKDFYVKILYNFWCKKDSLFNINIL